jgi:predicted PurR-regulated permease PerM
MNTNRDNVAGNQGNGGNSNTGKNISINITTNTIVKAILLVFFFFILLEIKDVVLIVLTAVVIASATEPAIFWLHRHKVPRLPSVIITYVLLAGAVFCVFYFLLPTLLNDFASYLSNLPKYLDYAQAWLPVNHSLVSNTSLVDQISSSSFSLSQVVANIGASFNTPSEGFVQTVTLLFGGVLSFILIVVLSFYLAVQVDGVENFLKIITPAHHEKYVVGLWKRSQHKIGLWMQGQLLLGVTVGVLVYLSLTIFGLPHALLLALLAALFEIIPVFGPILSAIPGVLVALAYKGIPFGILIGVAYLIIQQFENHVFYPLVVKKIIGISPIVVIIALIIGAKLEGLIGVILSVPISTTLIEYIHDVQKNRITENALTNQI